MQPPTDKRAKKILFDTYWGSAGWKRTPATPAADFDYAKSMGIMFDPVSLTHDELIEAILRLRDRIEPAKAARAFLGSLSTRRVHWRSGLASITFASRLSRQAYDAKPSGWASPKTAPLQSRRTATARIMGLPSIVTLISMSSTSSE